MFPNYIIENFISILNNKNSAQATVKELNYNSENYDKFLQDLQILEMYDLVKIQKSKYNNPKLLLTFKGAYYGNKYINNYDKILEVKGSHKNNPKSQSSIIFYRMLCINYNLFGGLHH